MLRPAARPVRDFLRQALALVLLAPLLAFCRNPTAIEVERDSLARNRALWTRQHVTSYRFTMSRSCECLAPQMTGPAVVEVRNGNLTAQLAAGAAADTALFTRVEGMFDLIQRAVDARAEVLAVEYDRTLGYPTSINIDYSKTIADDEFSVFVTSFERL